jgi:spore germination protein GerM
MKISYKYDSQLRLLHVLILEDLIISTYTLFISRLILHLVSCHPVDNILPENNQMGLNFTG